MNLPQSSKSGARKNSIIFMVNTTMIWLIAFNLDLYSLMIQIAIAISDKPISIVSGLALVSPSIRATISWCLGTRFKTLQINPLISHTAAISHLIAYCLKEFFTS